MKVFNIQWDVDNEYERSFLPDEILIPDNIARDENGIVDEEAISDFITEETGYCHYGFEFE